MTLKVCDFSLLFKEIYYSEEQLQVTFFCILSFVHLLLYTLIFILKNEKKA